MSQNPVKKPPLYTVINELLNEHGESVTTASKKPLFNQRVAREILDLFSPSTISAFDPDTTRALLESFEKGAISLQDIYLLRDYMVDLHKEVTEQEANMTLHEAIRILLQGGKVGESIATVSKALLGKNIVSEAVLSSYKG